MLKSSLAFFMLLLNFGFCLAQKSEYPQTNNIDRKAPLPKFNREKRYYYIIKPNTWGTMYGNPCVAQVNRKMGFEYLIQPFGLPGYRNEFVRWMHNLGVKTVLFFRNGPFWKSKFNKKVEECKYKSGDYIG